MATPAPGAAPVSRQTQAWRAHWLAEIIRLREEHWGPLEDADAVRQARNAPGTLETRILMRARLLAQREGHDGLAARWRQGAVYSLLGLLAAAVIAGVASAAGALGDGSRPVNVLWALGALLRSEEHTSELQSRENLVCRLLLEKTNSTHLDEHNAPT